MRSWVLLCVAVALPAMAEGPRPRLSPSQLPRIATVDERYQSYDLETSQEGATPVDLSRPLLRKLAAALGPAYLRVSASGGDWKGAAGFAHAVNAKIVTSFAVGRRAAAWQPDEARKRMASTKPVDGQIAAAELFDHPGPAAAGAAPPDSDAAAFARDVAAFRSFARQSAPRMLVVGPGSAAGAPLMPASLPAEALLGAEPRPVFDVVSYHFHGALPARCARGDGQLLTSADKAMSEDWLSRIDKAQASFEALRDRFHPGKPIWVTETADAACGGNPWASSFLDTFRYVDQLARLARRGVKVHMHDALASGDSGLLDEKTLAPRPKYWAAVLWRRLMGTTVLDAGPSREGLHLYAHCLRGHRGGVVILAINNTRNQPESIELPVVAERYTLSVRRLQQSRADLNGNELKLQANDALPGIHGVPVVKGTVPIVPATINFLVIAKAGNPDCR